MGEIVLMGIAAAMTNSPETCERRTHFFGDTYFVCY